jgi:transposase
MATTVETDLKEVSEKIDRRPPYSPDLNRIETCWAWLKSRIRKHLRDSDNLRDAMEFILQLCCVLTFLAMAIHLTGE